MYLPSHTCSDIRILFLQHNFSYTIITPVFYNVLLQGSTLY